MLSVFFKKKISIFGPPEGGPKTPHRENVPFSLCAISCGAPSRRDGWLHNKPHIQFALQSYRLNLQLNAQFLDPPTGGLEGSINNTPPAGRGPCPKNCAERKRHVFAMRCLRNAPFREHLTKCLCRADARHTDVYCIAPLRGASQKIEIFMKSPLQNILF